MNPITLHITLSDGSKVTAVATAPDFVAFEAKFDKSVQTFVTDVRLTYLFFMAWHSLKRNGEIESEFEVWLEDVTDVQVDEPKK
jgi:hypothetical protein